AARYRYSRWSKPHFGIPGKEPIRRSAGAGVRRRVVSRRVGRDLPLPGGASSRAKLVRARPTRTSADRDVEPAHGIGAIRGNRTDGSKYEFDLSGPFQAIPRLRRNAAWGRASTTRTDG